MANLIIRTASLLPSAKDAPQHFGCRTASTHLGLSFKKAQQSRRAQASQRDPSCRCELGRNDENDTASQTNVSEESSAVQNGDCRTTDSESTTRAASSTEGPTKPTNKLIALSSATAAVVLFLITRGGLSGATLGELAASAVPYEEALSNGRPTVVEFYADWCEVCREMAPDIYKVEQQYKDVVNFVMLNVDNTKWEEELDEFGVEGIPHFAFLDRKGNEEGNIVGRLPKRYLEDNVMALSKGEEKLPHSRLVGQFSNPESHQAPRVADPRSHGV